MGSDHRSRLPGFPPLTEDHANILVSTKQSTCLLTAAFVTYWEDEVSSIVCIKSVANNRQASEFICTSNMCLQGDTIITHSIITVLRVTPLLLTVSSLYTLHRVTPLLPTVSSLYSGWHHYYPQYKYCTSYTPLLLTVSLLCLLYRVTQKTLSPFYFYNNFGTC